MSGVWSSVRGSRVSSDRKIRVFQQRRPFDRLASTSCESSNTSININSLASIHVKYFLSFLSQELAKNPKFVVGSMSRLDLHQGGIGNSFFVAVPLKHSSHQPSWFSLKLSSSLNRLCRKLLVHRWRCDGRHAPRTLQENSSPRPRLRQELRRLAFRVKSRLRSADVMRDDVTLLQVFSTFTSGGSGSGRKL